MIFAKISQFNTKVALIWLCTTIMLSPFFAHAQTIQPTPETVEEETSEENEEQQVITADAGPVRDSLIDQELTFSLDDSHIPNTDTVTEILWNFGDGVRTTGNRVTHAYATPGQYTVTLTIRAQDQTLEDTTQVNVFEHLIVLAADSSASEEELTLRKQQAADEGVLVLILKPKSAGPEVLIEEELANQLIDVRSQLQQAHLIIMWTSGGVGANVLTKFAQHIKQSEGSSLEAISMATKGIILLSQTPLGVLQPTAQSAFDQLEPSYVLLARPQVLDLLLTTTMADTARDAIITSPLDYRLLGKFSARAVDDLGLTNFLSFGINFLVNRGVPAGSIVLILMLPIIATIIAFARQVIGIKAFGLITPAMTTVSFLGMGLQYGLIVFAVVLLSGTISRFFLRKLRLLYLPRMALVLTSISLALLLLLGVGVVNDRQSILSFSIFPALILTILAEEFIAAQFKMGARRAMTITAWTLALATVGYYLVSSEIFRTLVLSYPEIVLLAIPVNIAMGKWTGLRLVEHIRFRQLIHYGKSNN